MHRYLVLDLETTGLNPYRDDIIQVALRRDDGVEWSSFVRPTGPVPRSIQQLVHWDARWETEAPPWSEVAPILQGWLGQSTVVGHNIGFDAKFLARYGIMLDHTVDTLAWAKLAFPLQGRYRLIDFFPEAQPRLHDARTDVALTFELVQRIRQALRALPQPTQNDLARLLGDAWRWWQVEEVELNQTAPVVISRLDDPQPEPPETAHRVSAVSPSGDDIQRWLSPQGQWTQALPHFEERPGQFHMLNQVAEALEHGQIVLAQAGTGTGKSLAYLIPALYYAASRGCRVVVATHTLALQEQLWQKELDTLCAPWPFRASLLKGQARYVCLLKVQELREQWAVLAESSRRRLGLARLLTYLAYSERGDGEEAALAQEEAELWQLVQADRDTCLGPRCPYAGNCYLREARRRAESSHVIVTNQALLTAHLAQGNILPDFEVVIIDEAHHFGEAIERGLGFEWAIQPWLKSFRELVDAPQGAWTKLPVPQDLRASWEDVRRHLRTWADKLGGIAEYLVSQTPPSEFDRRLVRVDPSRLTQWQADGWWYQWQRQIASLSEICAQAQALLQNIVDRALNQIATPVVMRVQHWMNQLAEIAAGLAQWGVPSEERVSWWEVQTGRHENLEVSLRWAPLEIGQLLHERLWNRVRAAVLTSATLAVANRLDYAADQLGVPPERRRDLIVPSPFDWSRQARLLVASNAPDPRSPAYLPTLADFLYPLALVRHGRVLVLLTSYRAVQALSWTLREPLAAHGIRVLAQGEDGSPRLLVESFRQDPAAVLMGTASFWEGVDIPGTDLEIVVLGRLPFRAPGDPLEDARLERVAQRGGSAFLERTVPEAVIRFQQGFGRLIRTQRDRGVVVVFDPRILPERTSYGRYFMASLPPIPWSARPLAELVDQVRAFWRDDNDCAH